MVPSDLNAATRSCDDLETWLDPTINPCCDLMGLHLPVQCEPIDTRKPALHVLLEGYAGSRIRIVNESVSPPALSHRRPARHDDQVRVLEPSRHPVEVVEPGRHPDHPLPALHLERDPLHRGTKQVVQLRKLALVA